MATRWRPSVAFGSHEPESVLSLLLWPEARPPKPERSNSGTAQAAWRPRCGVEAEARALRRV